MAEHSRDSRMVQRLFISMIVAIMALLLAVLALQSQTKQSIADNQAKFREVQTAQLVGACQRSVRRDFEAYGTNKDLAGFARDAAAARRSQGYFAIARRYDKRAVNAETRMASIKQRLPAHDNTASITAYCRVLFPVPQ